jgi:hypothetical protein
MELKKISDRIMIVSINLRQFPFSSTAKTVYGKPSSSISF